VTGQQATATEQAQGIVGFAYPSLADYNVAGIASQIMGVNVSTNTTARTQQWFEQWYHAQVKKDPTTPYIFALQLCGMSTC
jgi:hypothetical protein